MQYDKLIRTGKNFKHPLFGMASIRKNPQTKELYLRKTLRAKNSHELSNVIAIIQKRIDTCSENILKILDLDIDFENLQVHILFQHPDTSLSQRVSQIKKNFKEKQIFLESILKGLTDLQKQDMVHGHISIDTIFYNTNTKQYILIDNFLLENVRNYDYLIKLKKNQKLYISPEITNYIGRKLQVLNFNPLTQDTFSLGMVFLELVSSEKQLQQCYSIKKKQFSIDKLDNLKKTVLKKYSKQPQFKNLFKFIETYLLQYNILERPFPDFCLNILQSYLQSGNIDIKLVFSQTKEFEISKIHYIGNYFLTIQDKLKINYDQQSRLRNTKSEKKMIPINKDNTRYSIMLTAPNLQLEEIQDQQKKFQEKGNFRKSKSKTSISRNSSKSLQKKIKSISRKSSKSNKKSNSSLNQNQRKNSDRKKSKSKHKVQKRKSIIVTSANQNEIKNNLLNVNYEQNFDSNTNDNTQRKQSFNRRQSIRKVDSEEKIQLLQKNKSLQLDPKSKLYEETIETEEIEGDQIIKRTRRNTVQKQEYDIVEEEIEEESLNTSIFMEQLDVNCDEVQQYLKKKNIQLQKNQLIYRIDGQLQIVENQDIQVKKINEPDIIKKNLNKKIQRQESEQIKISINDLDVQQLQSLPDISKIDDKDINNKDLEPLQQFDFKKEESIPKIIKQNQEHVNQKKSDNIQQIDKQNINPQQNNKNKINIQQDQQQIQIGKNKQDIINNKSQQDQSIGRIEELSDEEIKKLSNQYGITLNKNQRIVKIDDEYEIITEETIQEQFQNNENKIDSDIVQINQNVNNEFEKTITNKDKKNIDITQKKNYTDNNQNQKTQQNLSKIQQDQLQITDNKQSENIIEKKKQNIDNGQEIKQNDRKEQKDQIQLKEIDQKNKIMIQKNQDQQFNSQIIENIKNNESNKSNDQLQKSNLDLQKNLNEADNELKNENKQKLNKQYNNEVNAIQKKNIQNYKKNKQQNILSNFEIQQMIEEFQLPAIQQVQQQKKQQQNFYNLDEINQNQDQKDKSNQQNLKLKIKQFPQIQMIECLSENEIDSNLSEDQYDIVDQKNKQEIINQDYNSKLQNSDSQNSLEFDNITQKLEQNEYKNNSIEIEDNNETKQIIVDKNKQNIEKKLIENEYQSYTNNNNEQVLSQNLQKNKQKYINEQDQDTLEQQNLYNNIQNQQNNSKTKFENLFIKKEQKVNSQNENIEKININKNKEDLIKLDNEYEKNNDIDILQQLIKQNQEQELSNDEIDNIDQFLINNSLDLSDQQQNNSITKTKETFSQLSSKIQNQDEQIEQNQDNKPQFIDTEDNYSKNNIDNQDIKNKNEQINNQNQESQNFNILQKNFSNIKIVQNFPKFYMNYEVYKEYKYLKRKKRGSRRIKATSTKDITKNLQSFAYPNNEQLFKKFSSTRHVKIPVFKKKQKPMNIDTQITEKINENIFERAFEMEVKQKKVQKNLDKEIKNQKQQLKDVQENQEENIVKENQQNNLLKDNNESKEQNKLNFYSSSQSIEINFT